MKSNVGPVESDNERKEELGPTDDGPSMRKTIRSNALELVLAFLAIAVVTTLMYVISLDSESVGELVLDCALPTERPTMTAPSVVYPEISDPISVRAYAVQYFPELGDADFVEVRPNVYRAELINGSVYIHQNGLIIYNRFSDYLTYVDIDDFPADVASGIAVDFIETHGGIGEYVECQRIHSEISIDGKAMDEITGHEFMYHRRYDGYWIGGADVIMVGVGPDGPSVDHYYRGCYELGEPSITQQVISAATAWKVLSSEAVGGTSDIAIVSVELCYYRVSDEELAPVLFPAWAFISDEGLHLFVNAFTGEYMA